MKPFKRLSIVLNHPPDSIRMKISYRAKSVWIPRLGCRLEFLKGSGLLERILGVFQNLDPSLVIHSAFWVFSNQTIGEKEEKKYSP